jgi:hypothetical protein
MATKEKLAFLKAHLEEISQNILRQVKEEIVALKKLQPRHPPRQKGRANNQALFGRRLKSPPPKKPKTPRANAKPLIWIDPTRMVRWNPPLGAQATVWSWVRASASTG